MSNQNQNNGNMLREFKLQLYAVPHENAVVRWDRKQEPTCALSIRDNQPRLTVRTNVQNDRNDGRIEANMDSYHWFALLEAIDAVSRGEIPEFRQQNKGFFFGREGRSKEPGVHSTTIVARDENDQIYMAIIAKDRPNIRFFFRPNEFHPMLDGQNQPMSMDVQSNLWSRGYVNLMRQATVRVLGDEFISYQDIKARKEANKAMRNGGGGYQNNNRGGNGGGYGSNGGGNSGNNASSKPAAPSDDWTDDIPF